MEGLGDRRINYLGLPPEGKSLGELRNLAVSRAGGEYLTQWDDDDLSDPRRLELQMAALELLGAEACLLARHALWWPERRRLALSTPKLWESSFVCRRDRLPAYPDLARGEDTPVIGEMAGGCRVVLLDAPWLYLYVCHSSNTWEPEHFEMWWETATAHYEGESYEALMEQLARRLDLEGLEERPGGAEPEGGGKGEGQA